jgi:hypothetical protein
MENPFFFWEKLLVQLIAGLAVAYFAYWLNHR